MGPTPSEESVGRRAPRAAAGRRRAVVGAGIVALAVAAGWLWAARRGIEEAWVVPKLESGDPVEANRAAERLGEIGSERCVPGLLALGARALEASWADREERARARRINPLPVPRLAQRLRELYRPIETRQGWALASSSPAESKILLSHRDRTLIAHRENARNMRLYVPGPTFDALLAVARASGRPALRELHRGLTSTSWAERWVAAGVLAELEARGELSSKALAALWDPTWALVAIEIDTTLGAMQPPEESPWTGCKSPRGE